MSGNRSVFEGGPDANSMDLGFGPDPQPQPQDNQEPAAGGVHLTQEQFQQLLAGLGQQRQELDYAAAISGQQTELQALPDIDLDQLPDPRVDFDAFKGALGQVLSSGRDQIVSVAQQQIQAARSTDMLLNEAWETMQERYPELVGEEDVIAAAREREVASLTARGIDWTVALRNNMDAAIDAVASRALATVERRRSLQSGDGDGSHDRTDMISGGSPRQGVRRAPKEDTSPSLVDDIKKIQREMGIY